MDNTSQISNNSIHLKNRTLVYDGDSIMSPEHIENMILDGIDTSTIYTTKMNDTICEYNIVSESPIYIKTSVKPYDMTWNIPDEYLNMNVLEHVINKYITRNLEHNDMRYARLLYEMKKFKDHNLYPFLQTLIYVSDVITSEKIVKGVGRGSSVASYVLYIIGIHSIDSYKYDLDFEEFIN